MRNGVQFGVLSPTVISLYSKVGVGFKNKGVDILVFRILLSPV